MKNYLAILLGTMLVDNFALARFLGLCPFMGVSRRLQTAAGMGLATGLVLTLSSALSHLLGQYLLIPLGLGHLRLVVFIVAIAAVVQFTEMAVRKTSPLLYQALGVFLPLIATNCAVLGVALLNARNRHGFVESLFYGFGAAAGFALVLALFAALRERLDAADVPAPFRGHSIAFVTAGLASMAFMGFSRLVKN